MEKTLIVANWKENFTASEAERWADELNKELRMSASGDSSNLKNKGETEVVVCPPFVLIPVLKSQVSSLPPDSPQRRLPRGGRGKFQVHLGAQDVSKFEEGQYTGEVSAKMLKDFVKHVIVGHSERRKYFGEMDEDVELKIEQCLKHNLIPIVCVNNLEQVPKCQSAKVPKETIFAYEPLFAVGTDTPDTPENAQKFAEKIKGEVGQDVRLLYGGSVNAENVKLFVSRPDIDGVLVGQASLDAAEFAKIVKGCQGSDPVPGSDPHPA